MSYHVTCGCGRSVPVAAADAGADVPCGCGRVVEVPPLHLLRTSTGEAGVSPVVSIRALLLAGRLPGTRRCAVCDRETDGLAHAAAQCEWAVLAGGRPTKAEIAGGCLLSSLSCGLGALLFAYLLGRGAREAKQYGEDVTLTVPVRACDDCRPGLADPAALRAALRETPEYAALLDRYPNARIRFLG